MIDDDKYLNAYCPCCGWTTTKHASVWECRRCGALSDDDDWNDAVYSWHKGIAHLELLDYSI